MADRIDVVLSGPLFDGSVGRRMHALVEEIEDVVGEHVLAAVRQNLRRSVRRGSGHYLSRVVNQRRADDRVVTDQGVVYGPWLEGASRRNRSTGFAGYRAFRRARDEAAGKIGELTRPVVERHLAGLG